MTARRRSFASSEDTSSPRSYAPRVYTLSVGQNQRRPRRIVTNPCAAFRSGYRRSARDRVLFPRRGLQIARRALATGSLLIVAARRAGLEGAAAAGAVPEAGG